MKHVIYGIIMGYYLGKVKFEKEHKLKNLFFCLLLPIFIHGIYDYFIIAYQYNLRKDVLPSYIIIIINVIFANMMIEESLKKSPFKLKYRMLKARKSYEKYIKKLKKVDKNLNI